MVPCWVVGTGERAGLATKVAVGDFGLDIQKTGYEGVTPMRAEAQAIADEIERALSLLRRHL